MGFVVSTLLGTIVFQMGFKVFRRGVTFSGVWKFVRMCVCVCVCKSPPCAFLVMGVVLNDFHVLGWKGFTMLEG